ncbi:MAG: hypothetical protein DRJ32_01870 [Thermoprotei archaeon]|nr:MAG: hypothetical protein DRJ32_01870 [Thermoprotei archaeon]
MRRDVRSLIRIASYIVRNYFRYAVNDDLAQDVADRFSINPSFALVLIEAFSELRDSFSGKSGSWYIRAIVRMFFVKKVGRYAWVVEGIREFGDYYPAYQVWLVNNRYHCSCHTTKFGYRRRKSICTHVAAVILSRKVSRKIGEYF